MSGVEAPPSTRLFNLWVEQKLGTQANLRVGQFTAAQEFMVSQNATLFLNATFGWPLLASTDLPSGGPAYPEATPGARITWLPRPDLTVSAAIFNGDPAGPGGGNPVWRDRYGVAFRLRDPPFAMAEVAYGYNQAKGVTDENPNQEGGPDAGERGTAAAKPGWTALPGTVKLGAWAHAGKFTDQRFNDQGGLLAVDGGQPLQRRGDYAVYGVIDQALWRAPECDDCGLNAFLRASAAPGDRNPITFYLDGGLTYKGPQRSRPDDTVGIGFAFGRVSRRAAAQDRDAALAQGTMRPVVRDHEVVLEATYQVKVAENWSIQPDIQYVFHPGGHVPDPLSVAGAPIRNALVLGLRSILKF